jgi:two-component system LytT family response regulator
MIKAIIIDDEPLACEMLREMLEPYSGIELLATCHDGFQGIKSIQEHRPDLVFLDVQMPKLNGFEMLELLDEMPGIIFTTAFDQYALKAFENNAVDYLLKPYSKERFDQALKKFMQQSSGGTKVKTNAEKIPQSYPLADRVVIKNGTRIHIVPYQDMLVLEADDDYVKIRTAQGAFMKKKTLSYFENALPKDKFVRVHRSYILNIQNIDRLESADSSSHYAVLRNGIRVPVSRNGLQLLKNILNL